MSDIHANQLLGKGFRFEWASESIVFTEDLGDVDPTDVSHVECLTLLDATGQEVDHLGGVLMPPTVGAQRAARRAAESEMARAHAETSSAV